MNALKLPFKFDTTRIKQELAQFTTKDYYDIYNPSVELETLWSKHFIEPVIGSNGLPVFLPNASLKKCPYLLSVLDAFQCDKETFRVHSLEAGASIKAHRDLAYSLEHGRIRLHIPVETNSKVELLVNGESIKMKEGECWYCNFHLEHEVHNYSDKTRTHLILDCVVNDWMREVFVGVEFPTSKNVLLQN